MTVLYLGLICWLLTTIVVDSVLFAPLRGAVGRWAKRGRQRPAYPDLFMQRLAASLSITATRGPAWRAKVAYLVTCHLCAGVWIGLALGAVAGGPFDVPLVGWVLAGLTYKAIGHAALEVSNLVERLGRPAPPMRVVNQFHDDPYRQGVVGNWPGHR